MGEGAYWSGTGDEGRKHGERTGLDTPVVHAVNYGYEMLEDSTPSVSQLTH